jgi:hypothetical protein
MSAALIKPSVPPGYLLFDPLGQLRRSADWVGSWEGNV